jgi:hypothetical protein
MYLKSGRRYHSNFGQALSSETGACRKENMNTDLRYRSLTVTARKHKSE